MIKVLKTTARRYADAPVEPEYMEFGQYFQENAERKTPISWVVLAKDGEKLLLLSRYALDYRQFHHECIPVTWENCDLRKWLNTLFLEEAFSEAERKRMVLTFHGASADSKYGNISNTGTGDYIFSLSSDEVSDLLEHENESFYRTSPSPVRCCEPTYYVCTRGAHLDRVTGCSGWWLRTPETDNNHVFFINSHGLLLGMPSDVSLSVRPALWVITGNDFQEQV